MPAIDWKADYLSPLRCGDRFGVRFSVKVAGLGLCIGDIADSILKNSGPWLAGMRPMLLLLTADASEKVTGTPPIHSFNRLEAFIRCCLFALPADSDDLGRDL